MSHLRSAFTQYIGASLLFISLLLSGCGGGGGSGSTSTKTPPPVTTPPVAPPVVTPPPPPELTITAQNVPVNVPENTTHNITFTVAGVLAGFKMESQFEAIPAGLSHELTQSGNTISLQLKAEEFTSPNIYSYFKITVTDGEGRVTYWDAEIEMVNTSANEIISKLEGAKSSMQDLLDLKQETALIQRLEEVAMLLSGENAAKSKSYIAKLKSSPSDVAYMDLVLWQDSYAAMKPQFNQIQESDIVNLQNDLISRTDIYLAGSREIVANAIAQTGAISQLNLDGVYLSEQTGHISQFEGNPALGQYIDGQWVFNSDVAFLTAIIFPETQVCNAE